jgi:toxic protein SymE
VKKNKRILKIYAKHKISINKRYITVPEIKLSGKWLKDWGFQDGQLVLITCEENRIIITLN